MYPGPLKKGRAELNLCINRLKAINPTTIHSNDFLCTRVKEESMGKLGKKKKNPHSGIQKRSSCTCKAEVKGLRKSKMKKKLVFIRDRKGEEG